MIYPQPPLCLCVSLHVSFCASLLRKGMLNVGKAVEPKARKSDSFLRSAERYFRRVKGPVLFHWGS